MRTRWTNTDLVKVEETRSHESDSIAFEASLMIAPLKPSDDLNGMEVARWFRNHKSMPEVEQTIASQTSVIPDT